MGLKSEAVANLPSRHTIYHHRTSVYWTILVEKIYNCKYHPSPLSVFPSYRTKFSSLRVEVQVGGRMKSSEVAASGPCLQGVERIRRMRLGFFEQPEQGILG